MEPDVVFLVADRRLERTVKYAERKERQAKTKLPLGGREEREQAAARWR